MFSELTICRFAILVFLGLCKSITIVVVNVNTANNGPMLKSYESLYVLGQS